LPPFEARQRHDRDTQSEWIGQVPPFCFALF
jgi:hypothetical protein